MAIPTDLIGVFVVVALVVPGTVFGGVRTWLRGHRWSDQTTASRVLEAVLVSVILDAVYLWVIGSWLAPWIVEPRSMLGRAPATSGLAVLLMVVVVPAALAFCLHADLRLVPLAERGPAARVRVPRRRTAFESAPTAWDKVAPTRGDRWVRVLLPSGERVGGWMSSESYVSTFPHARDMFIQEQFTVDADGRFGQRVVGTSGIWLAITDGCIVEWLENGPEEDRDDQ